MAKISVFHLPFGQKKAKLANFIFYLAKQNVLEKNGKSKTSCPKVGRLARILVKFLSQMQFGQVSVNSAKTWPKLGQNLASWPGFWPSFFLSNLAKFR